MKLLYFFITSSLLIGLVLLFRKLFRKKLSANVIYALWLLPFLRLLIPVVFLEVPVFGTAAEFINRPVAVVEEFFKTPNEIAMNIYEESLVDVEKNTANINAEKPSSEGIKIYDAAIPKENSTAQIPENNATLNDAIADKTADSQSGTKYIILTIWCAGSAILGGYVFIQNRKLRRKIDELEPVDRINGIDICISKVLKTPCLVGIHKPKIVLTGDVYVSTALYECAIQHEIAHYKNKDHLWNMIRICMCILYWWHPLVWYAAKCVAEDAELACDERVLKHKSLAERKNYGYALLKMIENAQNKPLCLATSFSGNKKSIKQRIEAITTKTNTKKYILFPIALVLIVLLAAGCVFPSNKSYIKTNDWKSGETEEFNFHEAEYEYSLQDEFQSMLFYYESYEYGELTERSILSYGDLEKYSDVLLLRNETYKYEEKDYLIFEMDGTGISVPIPIETDRGYAISSLYCEKDLLEIEPGDDLILMASIPETHTAYYKTYSCEILSTYDEAELKDLMSEHNRVFFVRLILSDLPAETLYEQIQKKEFPEMLSIDEYNDKYSKSKISEMAFYTEPEEKKVCLAVMPDGISKAGGDYRYIIPEDQVKWTDHYKQARSLAKDGAWREGERSAGIWIVFNDEWTCITDQGMIFDFERRVDKGKIKEFYDLCMKESIKYGTGTPLRSENVREIRSAALEYNGTYTVTDDTILTAIEKQLVSSPELRGGAACPFTASLTLEFIDNRTETIYLATDSCTVWLTDGVYHEYSVCENIEEIYSIFKEKSSRN